MFTVYETNACLLRSVELFPSDIAQQ
jgi:hypothetical protein